MFPEEVEQALKARPAVHDALVAGAPDERYGQEVAAVVSFGDGVSAAGGALGVPARVSRGLQGPQGDRRRPRDPSPARGQGRPPARPRCVQPAVRMRSTAPIGTATQPGRFRVS
ncbi:MULTISPECIES: AMP-binding enzyme [Dietzia]|uniref:AMP-binding enzyme n=1 Tax=Dietzia TaxID=37914 RepID=UPI0020A43E39|nr:hypothetical protein [Dietzia kunjamensis]MCZ4654747.1 hypothetical protein [Dietzia kunjamensis]